MRTKTEYVVEKNDKGKTVPRKIGLSPIIRDGIEYEFDVFGEMDLENTLTITKSRCFELNNEVINKPSDDVARMLLNWVTDGVDEEKDLLKEFESLLLEADSETAQKARDYISNNDCVTGYKAMIKRLKEVSQQLAALS